MLGAGTWANIVVNGSFEEGSYVNDGNGAMVLGVGSAVIPGWTVLEDDLAWIDNINNFQGYKASDGVKSLDLTAYGTGAPYAGVKQTIATVTGNYYEVKFDQGIHPFYTSTLNCIEVMAAGKSKVFTATAGAVQKWETMTWQFQATSDQTELAFYGVLGQNDIGLDNVRVEAAPEAASLAAIGTGLLALRLRRKA